MRHLKNPEPQTQSVVYIEEEPPTVARDHLLDALTRDHDRRILALAQSKAMEAQEIMDETGIPRSTVYRRVSTLLERGLLDVEEVVVKNGHRVERYRSACSFLGLTIQEGSIEIQWTEGDEGALARTNVDARD